MLGHYDSNLVLDNKEYKKEDVFGHGTVIKEWFTLFSQSGKSPLVEMSLDKNSRINAIKSGKYKVAHILLRISDVRYPGSFQDKVIPIPAKFLMEGNLDQSKLMSLHSFAQEKLNALHNELLKLIASGSAKKRIVSKKKKKSGSAPKGKMNNLKFESEK